MCRGSFHTLLASTRQAVIVLARLARRRQIEACLRLPLQRHHLPFRPARSQPPFLASQSLRHPRSSRPLQVATNGPRGTAAPAASTRKLARLKMNFIRGCPSKTAFGATKTGCGGQSCPGKSFSAAGLSNSDCLS